MEVREVLRKLGFSEYEAKVLGYLNSVEEPKDAKEISKSSGVPLTKLYSVLKDLQDRELVEELPGKVNQYRLEDRQNVPGKILDQKKRELEKEQERFEKLTEVLESSLDQSDQETASIRYFNSNERYWDVYNQEVSRLQVGGTYRIINNMRWSLSFLPEELENRPRLRSMVLKDLESMRNKRFVLHHMTNVKSMLKNIRSGLETDEERKQSIAQLLKFYSRDDLKSQHRITLAPDFKNILIVILKDSAFLEFYPAGDHTEISSAIQVKGQKIAKDFSNWFDAYTDQSDPEKDYEKFTQEILDGADQIMGIEENELRDRMEEINLESYIGKISHQ